MQVALARPRRNRPSLVDWAPGCARPGPMTDRRKPPAPSDVETPAGQAERQDIERLFDSGAEQALATYVRLLHPSDFAELFKLIDVDNWKKITAELSHENLAEVLADVDEHQRQILGDMLENTRLIEVVGELETDDAADVLADLPDEVSAVVLPALEDKEDIEALLAYPEDSAGGIMQTEVCRVRGDLRVADAIDAVREFREDVEEVFEVYVVDAVGRVEGTVALEDLVLSGNEVSIASIRRVIEVSVTPELDQEEVALLFQKYDVVTMPVVDGSNVLLGRITFDDVQDVLVEEASKDIMAMAGASTEELVYGSDFFRIALFRLPWLLASLFGALMTSQLVPLFSRVPMDTIVLTAFVPVAMAMAGNVGSQSAMIITRGLAIGKVSLSGLGPTFSREVLVGSFMGIAAGVTVGIFGLLVHGDAILGLALGLSIVVSMSAATLVGAGAPILFRRVGIDPAIAAGPLVTTSCDVVGVALYLLVAIIVIR